jgi:photosystem II stability/assembly factor-like uncharacterized protein
MKFSTAFFLFFIFFSQTIFPQWYQQTSGVGSELNSVFFIDELTGWAVGDDGVIINTTDGGNNWSEQVSGTINYFTSVFFISASEGWAVGGNFSPNLGMIHHTTNGGTSWPVQTDTLPNQLNAVFFISPTTGWAVGEGGNQILKTTDGGLNWLLQTAEASYYRGLYFVNDSTGWAVGGNPSNTLSKILKTTDGGENWIAQTAATTNYLRAVFFISETTGWVAGNLGVIFKTTDGGTNWEPQNSDTTDGLYSIHFIDNNSGWMVGPSGLILYTTDSGSNWTTQNSGTNSHLSSIFFTDANNGWAVGSQGTILYTSNGGVIPVELTAFTASTSNSKVTLNWTTATETNNSGFEIQRKLDNSDWERICFVEGYGTTTEPKEYSYVDDISSITASSFAYRLKQIDFDGSYEYSEVLYLDNFTPSDFALHQNFPNPFNPVTIIRYSIPLKSQVEIVIYNTLGEKVKQLVSEEKEAGSYSVEFNASSLPSGNYFYRLQADSFIETKKLVLMK